MSENRCECGTLMYWDDDNDQFVCFKCVEKQAEPMDAIESAERAIVDAADKYRSADANAMADLLAAKWALIDAVDAWRKLKGGA